MFDLFRSRDKAVRIMLGAILGVVALSMVTYLIPGGWMNGNTNSNDSNVVATVGDRDITAAEAQRVISSMMKGRQLPPEILSMYAPQVVNNLISERAMVYEAKRLGFEPNDADTAESVRKSLPPQLFKDGKLVSKELYSQVLAQQGLTIEEFESENAQQVLINRLRDYIAAGVVVSPAEVEQEYRKRNEKTQIDYVLLPTAKYAPQTKASDAELQAYFDKHKAEYQLPEKKALAVLIIDPSSVMAQLIPTEADLQALYRTSLDKFQVPDRVKIRQILLKSDASNDKDVKAKIDDLEKQLKGGADFAELAKKNSQDPTSAAKGGDLDWVVRGQTAKEVEAAAFSLPVGEISQPIKASYGYHIIQVMDKQQARTIPFDEARPTLITTYRDRKMNDVLQTSEDKAVAALRKNPSDPGKAAADSHAQMFVVPNWAPGDPLPGVGQEKEVDTAVVSLKKGQISQPVVLKGNKIVIADVISVTPARQATLQDVLVQVGTKVNAEKLQQTLSEKANELMAKAKAGDLKKAAKEMGLEVKSPDSFTRNGAVEGAGSASTFTDAFNKPVGSVIGPYSAQGSLVVAQIVEHTEANMAEFPTQRDSIRDSMVSLKARDREEIFMAGLRKRLEQEKKIQVHDDVLKRVVDSYTGKS